MSKKTNQIVKNEVFLVPFYLGWEPLKCIFLDLFIFENELKRMDLEVKSNRELNRPPDSESSLFLTLVLNAKSPTQSGYLFW